METIVCPYCDADVKVSLVEAEEGCCPECGSSITPSTIFGNPSDSDYDDYGDVDDYDKDFEDDDDDLVGDFDDDDDEENAYR
ncbi:MAG TPA: hypothetical protein QF753_20865 [Victivallales bacterium]|nr:hypothetical protein [Victivallales bacterium]